MNRIDLTPATARRALDGLRRPLDDDSAVVDAYAAAVWSHIAEPGDAVAGELIGSRGAAAALQSALGGEVRAAPSRTQAELAAALARWRPRMTQLDVDASLGRARRAGVRLVVPGDDEWPERTADLGPHAPLALWVRGRSLAMLGEAPGIAIVGARAATGYGEHVAAEMSDELARSGVIVVSGAAYGIDGSAHRAALSAGGLTVALLAGGVDRPYPAGHTGLVDDIAVGGAVLSETPCGTAPTKWRFLARNRLIAALSDATVVVEAGSRSGSLNTAAHAASLGRPLGAVPGPVTSLIWVLSRG